jgi:outer membrane protein assembly factor BamE (lipoprotein component of BamABCDE complex)
MALGHKGRFHRQARLALALAAATFLGGCNAGSVDMPSLGYNGMVQRGYQLDDKTLAGLKPGESKEKVLQLLGTPSTTSTVGGDAWYYISQTTDRKLAFMQPTITDQRVLAAYFKGPKLERVANYGMQDGKVFDFLNRTTPTAGGDTGFVQNMLTNLLKFQ